MAKKTRAALEAELRLLKAQRRSDGIATVGSRAVTWIGIGFCFWCVRLIVDSLAGKRTMADIGVNVLGKVGISTSLAWFLAASCGLYGVAQRRLRKDTVEGMEKRIVELEKGIDPKRSSSNLTPRGDTPSEDET